MAITVRQAVEIPTGRQTGTISRVETTESQNDEGETVHYLNIHVQTAHKFETSDGVGVYRMSCPAYITKQSQLGRFLTRLKLPFTVDEEFDERTLEGLNISFDVVKKPNKKGTGMFSHG